MLMLILEFTQDRIRLLRVAKKGQKITLSGLNKKTISGLSDERLSAAVSDILNEAGVKKPRPLILCVPRHLFTVRKLRLPSLDEQELKDMASLQVGKQLPYPAAELIWDFKVIQKRPDGYSDIFLALGHRNVIDRYLNVLKNANLEAEKVILSSEALWGWYTAVSGFKTPQEIAGQIKAIVDVDTAYIEILVLRAGILEFSRSFPFKNDLQEAAEEFKRTLHSYEKDNAVRVSSIVLTGIEQKVVALRPLLEGIEGIGPMEYTHPLKVVSMDYRESLSNYFDVSRDVSLASVLGVAYGFDMLKMDLLPPDLKKFRENKLKKKMFVKTISLILAASLASVGIIVKGMVDKNGQLELLNTKIKETEPKVKRLKEISQNIEIIRKSLNMKGSAVDVMREMFKIVPPEVSISVLDFELEKAVTVRGVSTDLTSVFKFASDLDKSVYFENCQIKYAQKRTLKEKEFVDFEISSKLSR